MESGKSLKRPYPFNEEAKGDAIFGRIQILDKDKESGVGIQISLINELQIEYDKLLLEKHNSTEQNYHMYIYEFFGVCEENADIYALSQDDFYEIEIVDCPDETSGVFATGTIIYSASPIERSSRTIKIKDKASEDINKQIKDNFKLNSKSIIKTKEDLDCRLTQIGIKNKIDKLKDKWCVKIVNVRQGNCIFVYNKESGIKFAFDIGYSVFEGVPGAGYYINLYSSEFRTSDSFVILSHWDMDHILGVTFIERKEIFKCTWITPEVDDKSSVSAQRLAKYIENTGNLISIDYGLNGQNLLGHTSGYFNLWKGKGYVAGSKITQENNRGLIVELSKFESHVRHYTSDGANKFLLPGDCEYEAMPDSIKNGRYHCLIVPHHGGEMFPPQFQQAEPDDIAIILAGYAKFNKSVNPHPDSEHIKNLIDKGYITMINTRSSSKSRRLSVIEIKS